MSAEDATRDLKVMLGDPRTAVLAMSGPLIVSFLVVQINSFADTTWCSLLGLDPSSAVSTISPVYWIVSGLGASIGVGAATAIARRLGRGEKADADSLAVQTMVVSVIISLVATPILWLAQDPLIYMMGADDVRDLCREYIDPIVLGTLPMVINGVVSGILRSEGAAKHSTAMLLVAAVLNIVLDPILMFGLDMGLAGAGWATTIATVISTCVGLWWYARGSMYLSMSFRGFRPRLDLIKEVLFVGIPRATETTLISLMSMIQRIFVIACGGTLGAALYNIPWRRSSPRRSDLR
ncbi:MAG: MATE family efflux transporter [Thermoplasmata archaeon]|nr:MATE family efflux transporter [Thermoplasmata archaeon]